MRAADGSGGAGMSGAQDAERVVLIAGPTASGKSPLALALAERIGGIVINADSMQVYGDLKVITARPTDAEAARVTHRLYGHVDAAVNYSVGQYVIDAGAALAEARRAGKVPIFVGGTGLYFKALTAGLAAVPPIPADTRASVRARLAQQGAPALHAELARRDPVTAARLNPNDRTRTALAPDRAALYARIDARFAAMLAAGALDEVRQLAARKLDPLLPAMKAHGVPWLIRHLAGEITLDAAAHRARLDTRHYAKRQFTWFRHQLGDWPRSAPEAGLDVLMGDLRRTP